jgi:hypothetical protein
LALSAESCFVLTEKWDSLGIIDGMDLSCEPKEGITDCSDTVSTSHKKSTTSTTCSSIDDFFSAMFAPCGDSTAQVRKHLITQRDAWVFQHARREIQLALGTCDTIRKI